MRISHFRVPKTLSFYEVKCTTFVVKMSFICIRIKIISKSMALHLASLSIRSLKQLGNGLFDTVKAH